MTQAEQDHDVAALTRNVAWLLGTRMVTMAIGLLGLPILMSRSVCCSSAPGQCCSAVPSLSARWNLA